MRVTGFFPRAIGKLLGIFGLLYAGVRALFPACVRVLSRGCGRSIGRERGVLSPGAREAEPDSDTPRHAGVYAVFGVSI